MRPNQRRTTAAPAPRRWNLDRWYPSHDDAAEMATYYTTEHGSSEAYVVANSSGDRRGVLYSGTPLAGWHARPDLLTTTAGPDGTED